MTSPTTPADAQFEAVLNEKCDQLSRELVASRKFTEAEARLFTHVARGAGTWARAFTLESEPVRALADSLRWALNNALISDERDRDLIARRIEAFERAKGDK